MVLSFDKKVMPDDLSVALEGFSIADKSGKFYMAHAAFALTKDAGIWNAANKNFDATKVSRVEPPWSRSLSPCVMDGRQVPWATLKSTASRGSRCTISHRQLGLAGKRRPAETLVDRAQSRTMQQGTPPERLEYRKTERGQAGGRNPRASQDAG